MENQSTAAQRFDFDIAPALKIYLDSLESWKENYEKLLQQTQLAANASSASMGRQPYEQALESWKQSSDVVFKRFVEHQIEICRFFGRRWERYLGLPEQFARCKTPADVAQLEMEFATRMAQDYAEESAKLMKPMAALAATWPSGQSPY